MSSPRFKALSLSYQTAPVEIREKVSLSEPEIRRILAKVPDLFGIQDVLILSTCNRTEVYYASEKDLSLPFIQLIAIEKGLEQPSTFLDHAQCLLDQREAIEHLFAVAMGLESQVVGDIQISNQVKNAYQWAADANLAGPFLHRLMHTIFFTNKRVAQETNFRDGAASVSYAAAELAGELAKTWIDPRVLVIGLGEMGQNVAKNLLNFKFENVTLTNRTQEKAEDLARECGFKALPFEGIKAHLEEFDIIISAVSLPDFIKKSAVEKWNIPSFKYLIDLSVPRSISPETEEVTGVLLYNIDEIQQRTDAVVAKRRASIPRVNQIIQEVLEDFESWAQEIQFSPTIQRLKDTLEEIRKEELSRYLKKVNESEAQLLEEVSRGMMQKILKLPVLQLKAACKRGEAETLVDVLNDLFNLEAQAEEVTK